MASITLSYLPLVVALIAVLSVVIVLLVWFSARSKRATDETDIGHYCFAFTNGEYIEGETTLANGLVKDEYLHSLTSKKHITEEDAKKLHDAFIKKFRFYALKSGRERYLIMSTVSIEDPTIAINLDQRFIMPLGYRSSRLIMAKVVSTVRAGWQIRIITPIEHTSEFLSAEKADVLKSLGEAAASIKIAAIRILEEAPWQELAEAREKEMNALHKKIQVIKGELSLTKMALARKPLQENNVSGDFKLEELGNKGFLSFGRIVFTVAIFAVCYLWIVKMISPTIDVFWTSFIVSAVGFFLYSWIKDKIFGLLGKRR